MKARPILATLPLRAIDAVRAIGSPTASGYAKHKQRYEEEIESKHIFSLSFIDI
jgi:hypothetical protein